MKQLLISEIFPPRTGGSGRWFWEIYRRLPRESYAVAPGKTVLPTHGIDSHPMVLARLPLTIPAWGMRSFSAIGGYYRALRAVNRLAREHRIDRLHCARLLPEGWIAWLLKRWRGIPYVCYVHGEETNYGVQSRELGWMMRRVLKGADFLIANSHNTARLLRENWRVAPERIRILHPGVDLERFVPAPREYAVRRELGWGERPVILTVGRLQRRKGHDVLLTALPKIRQRVPQVLYAIVGEGEERPHLEKLCAELGLADHVQWLGEVGDERLIECYQQCDLFVLPNREIDGDIEGFGMVLVEAQACAKPAIAGTSGGTAETMDVGRTGLLVDCRSADELAPAITELLLDEPRRAAMGSAGRRWVEEHFGWTALAETALSLFTGELQTAETVAAL